MYILFQFHLSLHILSIMISFLIHIYFLYSNQNYSILTYIQSEAMQCHTNNYSSHDVCIVINKC